MGPFQPTLTLLWLQRCPLTACASPCEQHCRVGTHWLWSCAPWSEPFSFPFIPIDGIFTRLLRNIGDLLRISEKKHQFRKPSCCVKLLEKHFQIKAIFQTPALGTERQRAQKCRALPGVCKERARGRRSTPRVAIEFGFSHPLRAAVSAPAVGKVCI